MGHYFQLSAAFSEKLHFIPNYLTRNYLNYIGQVSDLLLQYLDDLYMKRANAMEFALVSYPRSRKISISTHALKFSLYVLLCTVLL